VSLAFELHFLPCRGAMDSWEYLSKTLRVLGDLYMAWLIRTLRLPARETHTNLALAICVFLMSLMSLGLIWQAQIIADQRDAIKWLESLKFGS